MSSLDFWGRLHSQAWKAVMEFSLCGLFQEDGQWLLITISLRPGCSPEWSGVLCQDRRKKTHFLYGPDVSPGGRESLELTVNLDIELWNLRDAHLKSWWMFPKRRCKLQLFPGLSPPLFRHCVEVNNLCQVWEVEQSPLSCQWRLTTSFHRRFTSVSSLGNAVRDFCPFFSLVAFFRSIRIQRVLCIRRN